MWVVKFGNGNGLTKEMQKTKNQPLGKDREANHALRSCKIRKWCKQGRLTPQSSSPLSPSAQLSQTTEKHQGLQGSGKPQEN